jgi:hypothetical protein
MMEGMSSKHFGGESLLYIAQQFRDEERAASAPEHGAYADLQRAAGELAKGCHHISEADIISAFQIPAIDRIAEKIGFIYGSSGDSIVVTDEEVDEALMSLADFKKSLYRAEFDEREKGNQSLTAPFPMHEPPQTTAPVEMDCWEQSEATHQGQSFLYHGEYSSPTPEMDEPQHVSVPNFQFDDEEARVASAANDTRFRIYLRQRVRDAVVSEKVEKEIQKKMLQKIYQELSRELSERAETLFQKIVDVNRFGDSAHQILETFQDLTREDLEKALNDPYAKVLWDRDHPTCKLCGASFNLLRRKHHCRRCGMLVCSPCSLFTGMIPNAASPLRCPAAYDGTWHRICKNCFETCFESQTKVLSAEARRYLQCPVNEVPSEAVDTEIRSYCNRPLADKRPPFVVISPADLRKPTELWRNAAPLWQYWKQCCVHTILDATCAGVEMAAPIVASTVRRIVSPASVPKAIEQQK